MQRILSFKNERERKKKNETTIRSFSKKNLFPIYAFDNFINDAFLRSFHYIQMQNCFYRKTYKHGLV